MSSLASLLGVATLARLWLAAVTASLGRRRATALAVVLAVVVFAMEVDVPW